jgi:hypothetical protein
LAAVIGVIVVLEPVLASTQARTLDDVRAMVKSAEAAGLAGTAKKTRLVDARPAKPGEVILTAIKGEGKETQSQPAKAGDWVVRNRCEATGHEQYLVSSAQFPKRYEGTGKPAGPDGWQEYRPVGRPMRFVVLTPQNGAFTFTAPWGEPMVARPGDAIVQDPGNPADTYRVAAASFACTYEVVK